MLYLHESRNNPLWKWSTPIKSPHLIYSVVWFVHHMITILYNTVCLSLWLILLNTVQSFSFLEDFMWLIPILWSPYGAPGLCEETLSNREVHTQLRAGFLLTPSSNLRYQLINFNIIWKDARERHGYHLLFLCRVMSCVNRTVGKGCTCTE